MIRILIPLMLTLLLGPGVGHLYLRQYKKAILLILATLAAAMHLAWQAAKTFTASQLTAQNASQIFKAFSQDHPNTILIYDIVFAAIWAYALVDAFFVAKSTLPKNPEDEEQQ